MSLLGELAGLFRHKYKGEMLPYERERLAAWVRTRRPKVTIEVGTGLGGGSTLVICRVLRELSGTLYSCDPGRRPEKWFLREFSDVLRYFPEASSTLVAWLRDHGLKPDFIFFDGPEPPSIALEDLRLLEQFIERGTMFSMHDWHLGPRPYDGGQSTKAALVRPYIEGNPRWRCIEVLSAEERDYRGTWKSVGLCLYEWLG
jgi:hypothetical protein